MNVFKFKIVGTSPLLQHSPAGMKVDSGGLKTKKKYIPEEEAAAGVYRNPKGEIVIPSIAFRSAILAAAKNRKIGKLSARSVIAGSVFPIEEYCPLVHPKTGKQVTKYTVHSCRAVVQRSGVIRSRPKFDDWACDLAVEVDTEMLPNVEIVLELLNLAGKIIGVGDWRPEKLGTFGRFVASK
jgi:hypothetical protein